MAFQHETVSCFLCTVEFTQNSSQINLSAQTCSAFVRFVAEYFKTQVDHEIRHACPRCQHRVNSFCEIYQRWKNLGKCLDSTFDEIDQIHISAHVATHSEGQLDSDTEYSIVGDFLTKAREKRKQASGRNWEDQDAIDQVENGESHNDHDHNDSSDSEEKQDENKFNNSSKNNPDFHSPMDTDDEALRKTSKGMTLKMDSKHGKNDHPENGTTTLLQPNDSESEGSIILMEAQPHHQEQKFIPDQRQSESENKTGEKTSRLRSPSQTQRQSLMKNSPKPGSTMHQSVDFHCPKEKNNDKGKEIKNEGLRQLTHPPLKMAVNLKHLEHQELMRKPFRCRFCATRFITEKGLIQHFYRRHHQSEQQKIQLQQQGN